MAATPALVYEGEGGKSAHFVQDEGVCQSTLLPSKYYDTFNLMKFVLDCVFDFKCFKIQQFLDEIA